MPEKESLENIRKDLIDTFASFPESMGMPKAPGVIWATLAMEPDGLTMKELSQKTGYSLSTLSTHMKLLKTIQNVRCTKDGGVIKCKAVTAIKDIMMDKFRLGLHHFVEPVIKQLDKTEQKLLGLKQTEEVKNTLELVKKLRGEYEGMRIIFLVFLNQTGDKKEENFHGYG